VNSLRPNGPPGTSDGAASWVRRLPLGRAANHDESQRPGRRILVINNNRLANFDQLLTRKQVDAKKLKALGEASASPNTQTGGDLQVGVPSAPVAR
jgi:hypothetical protein